MAITVGMAAPEFALKNQNGEDEVLSSFRGNKSVLVVFYPFAFSGICSGELGEIQENLGDFTSVDVKVLAISCDHMFSLRAYADRDGLTFSLLSDFWPHGEAARNYGIFNEQAGAANRGSYLIDQAGTVRWTIEHGIGQKRELAAYREALHRL